MAEDWNFELISFYVNDVDQTNVLTNDFFQNWILVIFLVPIPLVAAVGQWLASSKADEKARLTAFSSWFEQLPQIPNECFTRLAQHGSCHL